jgi:hypothetical protein
MAVATPPPTGKELTETSCRHLVVVIDDACTAPDLCATLRAFGGGETLDALVLGTAHGSAATQWYVDEDDARAEATHRLRKCVACLDRAGIRARGRIGDVDPVQAIADAVHDYPADEILLITPPQRPSGWLRQNAVDRARRAFSQPVTHIVSQTTSPRRKP